ncbi:MAG: PH domain-containing protein [Planctomycetaceae bacterium]|jgi:uncharacterized membrane protein YdbT with pleckstrin-like domain|nr:PH domain-containing protein [Planctomycetaceae bacterium]
MNQTNLPNESPAANAANAANPNPNNSNPNNIKIEWNYSGKAMRAQFILYSLLSLVVIGGIIGAMFLGWIKDEIFMYSFIGAAVFITLIWVQYFITYFYRVLTIKYRLEDNRLHCYKGLFVQQRDTLELMYVNDLQLVRTLFDIIFNGGVGKLIIFSATDKTDNKLVITGVENPHYILDTIDKIRSKLREQRAFISGGDN